LLLPINKWTYRQLFIIASANPVKRKNGFPKFKSAKRSRKTYTTNNQKGTVAIIGNGIRLPKTGIIKAVIHRQPDTDWVVKSATVSQESDGKYYISVLFELETPVIDYTADINNAVGLDYASDGSIYRQ
jgi:putative transposase